MNVLETIVEIVKEIKFQLECLWIELLMYIPNFRYTNDDVLTEMIQNALDNKDANKYAFLYSERNRLRTKFPDIESKTRK